MTEVAAPALSVVVPVYNGAGTVDAAPGGEFEAGQQVAVQVDVHPLPR